MNLKRLARIAKRTTVGDLETVLHRNIKGTIVRVSSNTTLMIPVNALDTWRLSGFINGFDSDLGQWLELNRKQASQTPQFQL